MRLVSLLLLAVVGACLAGCRPAPPSGNQPSPSAAAEPVDSAVPAVQAPPNGGAAAAGFPAAEPPGSGDELAPIAWPAAFQPEELRAGIRDAAEYLARVTDERGKFAYIVNTDPDVPPTDEYNIVRHAGTMYGMGMYVERNKADAQAVKAALIRAGRFLRQQIEPVPKQADMLAIWSEPQITGRDEPRQARLGSSGLGLIGLTSLESVAPGNVPHDELAGLARFVLFMQRDDGGFYRKYAPALGGRIKTKRLLYYPGESALGLTMLYELDGNEKWLEAAARAVAFMARDRQDDGRPPADHWILLSTARIWPHYDSTSRPVSREYLINSAIELCERLMETSGVGLDDPRVEGCIGRDGRTCPTATRVEGLMAALSYIPAEHVAFRARVRHTVEDALAFLLKCQVSEGDHRGGIPYAMFRLPEDHPNTRRGFNERATEIRIDYVHHALSGMIQYDDEFLPPAH